MFQTLDGQRVKLCLGRWNPTQALESKMDEKGRQLAELVASSGLGGAAADLGIPVAELQRRYEQAKQAAAKTRKLGLHDVPILELIDELGYSRKNVAEMLNLPVKLVSQRYWSARQKLREKRHDEIIREAIPEISQRDYAAFELHFVLGYSTGRVSRILSLNRGHVVRCINRVRRILADKLILDPPASKLDKTRA